MEDEYVTHVKDEMYIDEMFVAVTDSIDDCAKSDFHMVVITVPDFWTKLSKEQRDRVIPKIKEQVLKWRGRELIEEDGNYWCFDVRTKPKCV